MRSKDPAEARLAIPLAGGAALIARGEPGATPILFLHGLAGGAWSWAPQAAALARSRRTYAWEARGHGETARVRDVGLADFYEDARQGLSHVIRSEGRSPIVAGHSLGGLLALALAASRPSDVTALFLVEPMYVANSSSATSSSLLPPLPRAVLAPLLMPFLFTLAENLRYDTLLAHIYARVVFDCAFYDRPRLERAWRQQRRQRPLAYRRLLLEFAGARTRFPLRQYAKEIGLPVYLLEATGLGLGTHFPNLVAQLRALGPNFTRRVIRGGHYLQLDREPLVTAALDEFATAIDRGANGARDGRAGNDPPDRLAGRIDEHGSRNGSA